MFKRQHHTKNYSVLTASFFLLVILILNFDKVKLREEVFNILDTLNSIESGVSGLPGLYGRSNMTEFSDSFYGIGKVIVREFPEKVLNRVPQIVKTSIFGDDRIPIMDTLQLDIKYLNWERLLSDRRGAVANGILIDRNEVKASFLFDGSQIKGKVRLKGDFNDHWRSTKKMSLVAKLSDDTNTVKGFKTFALHKPEARQHPYEQIFQELVKELGILSVTHDYVRVMVNGSNWGVMNIQERFSKHLLEKQKKKDSLIIKLGNESTRWKLSSAYGSNTGYQGGSSKIILDVVKRKKALLEEINRDRLSYISKKIENGDLKDIIDVDKFAKLALLALIWGDVHVTEDSNSRYYFNPYNNRLEPISADSSRFKLRGKEYFTGAVFRPIYNYSLNRVISEGRFEKIIKEVHTVLKKSQSYGKYYQSIFPNDFPIDYSILENNFNTFESVKQKLTINTHPEFDSDEIFALTIKQWDYAEEFLSVRHYKDGRLRIYNSLPIPLTVTNIYSSYSSILNTPIIIPGSISKQEYVEINTNKRGFYDGYFTVLSTVGGSVKEAKNDFTRSVEYFNPLEAFNNSKELPTFVLKNNNNKTFSIPPGIWSVKVPIVIDGSLILEAGTTLQFDKNAYLIVKGDLIAKGKIENKVIFEAHEKDWKGILVFDGSLSELDNVIIKDTVALNDGILSLTGGITFYNTNLSVHNLDVFNSSAEDAVNIVNSKFNFDNVSVSNTFSDAIDIDFSSGEIKNAVISNVGGDGIDLSGSKVNLSKIEVTFVKDKGLSVGEKSDVNIRQSLFSDIGVGIVSKDGSNVVAKNVRFEDFKLYAAMAYVKKPMFGTPKLKIFKSNISFSERNKSYFSQMKSSIFVDGEKVKEKSLDIDLLYKSEIMKK